MGMPQFISMFMQKMDENDDQPSDLGVLPALIFSEPIPLILGSVVLDSKLGHAEQTQGDGSVGNVYRTWIAFYMFLHPFIWVWINTYYIIPFFGGMNIHLPAILMFTRGTRS